MCRGPLIRFSILSSILVFGLLGYPNKSEAYMLPEYLVVIPLAKPSKEAIDISNKIDNITIPSHFNITLQFKKDFEGDCREVTLSDTSGTYSAFLVCEPEQPEE